MQAVYYYPMTTRKIYHDVSYHARKYQKIILYALVTYFISIWTVLRFLTHSTIYDLVTQQLVARAWLHGNFSPITLGTTHYFFKIIFLYIPMELLPGSKRLKLIVLTVVINVITFYLLYKILAKIMHYYKIDTEYLPVGIAWLAMIAGSAFWISFTNSRNLEVAGGVYLVFRIVSQSDKKQSSSWLIGTTLFASILFFSDTLQVYMTALPLIAYMLIYRKHYHYYISAVIVAGSALSKILFLIVGRVFNITFSGNGASFGTWDMLGAVKSTVILMAGSTDAGLWRVGINLLFVTSMSVVFMYLVLKKKIPVRLGVLVAVFIALNEVVYIVSGQAHHAHTSRYLIMLIPMIVVVIAASYSHIPKFYRIVIFVILLTANFVFLSSRIIDSNVSNNTADAHLKAAELYLSNNHLTYAYASMDTALSLNYYNNVTDARLTALACNKPQLVKAKSVPVDRNKPRDNEVIPLILDANAIMNSPFVCDKNMIERQLGQPSKTDTLSDGSDVLYYPAYIFKLLRF